MQDILSILPFNNLETKIKDNQGVGDIMKGILYTHNLYKSQYDKICKKFDVGNTYQIANNIYDYLCKHTHYKVESDNKQTLRSPSAILKLGANKKIGLDCKSYSLFIAGILDALKRTGKKINWCFRFANYRIFDNTPHHVFVVINPNTNNEIWVDPVINKFDFHKPYINKIDKMALVTISGVGVGRRRKNKSERKKEIKQKIKNRIKKGGKLLVKFNPATVTARNSFLLMVKMNIFGLARNLAKVQVMKPKELYKFWDRLGGKKSVLDHAINIGKNKGHKKTKNVGVLPAVAAAIAAATPIIVKITTLLKSCGIDTKKLGETAKKVIANVANNKIDQIAEKMSNEGGGESEFSSSEDSGFDESSEDSGSSKDSGFDESSEDSGSSEDMEPVMESSGDGTIEGIYRGFNTGKNRMNSSKEKRFLLMRNTGKSLQPQNIVNKGKRFI